MIKMKDKNHYTIVPNSYRKIVERGKIDAPKTQIQDRSLSWLGTDTSIKSGVVKQVYGPNIIS